MRVVGVEDFAGLLRRGLFEPLFGEADVIPAPAALLLCPAQNVADKFDRASGSDEFPQKVVLSTCPMGPGLLHARRGVLGVSAFSTCALRP